MKRIKIAIRVGVYLGVATLFFVVISNIWMVFSSSDDLYFDTSKIPSKRVALVLGTSKFTSDGSKNEFFEERINAAAELYHQGKVSHILVSGDNRSIYYNEPRDMLKALEERNIPKAVVTLDYAGLRTLDSIVRCLKIFGQTNVVIVTQEFHAYRALFIARYYGMNASTLVAKAPQTLKLRVMIRELIARPLAVLDLYVWNRQPQVMGAATPIM